VSILVIYITVLWSWTACPVL